VSDGKIRRIVAAYEWEMEDDLYLMLYEPEEER